MARLADRPDPWTVTHADALRSVRWIVVLLVVWAKPAAALDFSLPRGAVLVLSETAAVDSVAVPTGPFAAGRLPVETVEGRVTRSAFQISDSAATLLQILRPLRADLEAAGYDILLDCDEITCGGFEFRFATEVLPAPAMFVDLTNFRVLTARREASAVSVLVSAAGPRRFVQVVQVVPPEASEPDVAPDVAPVAAVPPVAPPVDTIDPVPDRVLGATLEAEGHVVLDDLSFETGRTELTEGPYASLGQLAGYLTDTPSVRIALVGHTDAVGSFDSNIAISAARAEAVRNRLMSGYGIAAERLSARGVGFLSPRASNRTESGRALNRRVEAVLLEAE